MTQMTGKKLTKEEELLLQDFSRNVSTKSNALFYGNAFIVSAIPICKSINLFMCKIFFFFTSSKRQNDKITVNYAYGKRQGTLKNNSERPGESRFPIQCSPRSSPFAAPFPIYCLNVLYSRFAIQ